jgi:SAM-dependent methyltransferase
MHLDWPLPEGAPLEDEYARYAEVYDVLFSDIDDDTAFYLGAARSSPSPQSKLLEIGVGTGRLTQRLLDAGYGVVGIDPSSNMLALAAAKLVAANAAFELVRADVRDALLGTRFHLAIAPYGMVAHLLTDADRLAAFKRIHEHLQPGGVFVFDDCPSWLRSSNDTALSILKTRYDAAARVTIRLMSNTVEAADRPVSLRYDLIDWLDDKGRVLRRMVVRIVLRNIALADELALLRQAGFHDVELLGNFDGRPFDADMPHANARLIFRCRRAA